MRIFPGEGAGKTEIVFNKDRGENFRLFGIRYKHQRKTSETEKKALLFCGESCKMEQNDWGFSESVRGVLLLMEKKYGVVLIGCGHIGQAHIEDIYYRDPVRIVGVVDYHEETARLFARKYGAESWSTDYHEYLKRPDVDIVIVATYATTHLQIVKDCIAAGKHVLCEKPMTKADPEAAREFYELAKKAPVKILIAHILRHNSTYNRVAQMIHDGAIGEVKLIRMAQNHHIMNKARYDRLMEDCPPFVDCGVHYVDVIRWFTGSNVVSIGGLGVRIGKEIPEGHFDYGLLTMTLENGAKAYYEAGWAESVAAENRKEFVGTKGRIRLILQCDRMSDREEGDLIEYYDAENKAYHIINNPSVYKNMWGQLSCLIGMIEGKEEPNPTLDEAYEAFRIVLAGTKALKENRVVSMSEEL